MTVHENEMDNYRSYRTVSSLLSVYVILQVLFGTIESARIHVISTSNHHKILKRDVSRDDSKRAAFSAERMPNSMALSIELDTVTSLELNLQRNDHVTDMVPVTIGVEGRIKPWKSPDRQDFAAYIDPSNYAAMFVKSKRNDASPSDYEYLGSFKMGDKQYVVEPRDFSSRRKRASDYANDYVVRAVVPSEYNYTYDSLNRVEKEEKYRKEIIHYASQMLEDRRVLYGVELLIVIDYAIYRNWYDRTIGDTQQERRDSAINSIRFYYTHIANGIDLRYMSIKEPDFGIYVRLSGFHIATTPDSSPWTEGTMVREVDAVNGRVYSDAYKALDELESWFQRYQQDLPFFDQATLFCGNKLFGGYASDGRRRNIAGLADINGICTPLRASVCQENGQYASTQTAAHEMGHSLGAFHDGQQNSCSKYDQYIMAPAPTGLNEDNFYNPYKFSPCSIQEIREQIRVMNVRNINCLVNEARHFNETEFKINLKTLPGQVISLDDQCRNLFGIHSYYCAGMINDEKMCLELICYDPFQKLCWGGHEQRAATGTTCGNKKWCEKGKCVYNERAPSAKDHCLTGDYQGRLYNGLTCLDVGYDQQLLCYEEHYNKSCCATCDAIFNKLYPNCPYGDKYDWCSFPENRRSDNCYDDRFKESCCEYCRQVTIDIADCEYGDKATWCAADVPQKPALCYSSDSLCCSTCPKYASGNSECKYGDKASWCQEYDHASDCYNGNIADLCCDFCGRAMRQYGLIGCPYGDRKKTCSRDMCADSANWYDCCYTCQTEAGNRRKLTTTTTTATTTTATTTTTTPTTTTIVRATTVTKAPACVDSATWCRDIDASSCYTVADICCKTCKKFYTGKADCEYGDHFSWCTGKRDLCGDPSYSDCCLTCEGFKLPTTSTPMTTTRTSATTVVLTTPPDKTRHSNSCVDKASWCINSNSYCYNDKETCCHTCSRAYTGIIGCEYGDHYTWCVEPDINCQHEHVKLGCCVACNKTASPVQPYITTSTTTSYINNNNKDCVDMWSSYCSKAKSNDCYYASYQSGCCATCSRFHTGVAGCEYGDRWSWCGSVTKEECLREDIAEPCCEICSQVNKSETSRAATTVTQTTTTTTTTLMTTTTTALFSGCAEDKASWCSEIIPSHCYGAHEACCITCSKHFIGKGGCEYGDKTSWCNDYIKKSSDCEAPGVLDNCCLTCDGYGVFIREKQSELGEGILLEINSTLKEVEKKQIDLIMSVAKHVNKFCIQNVDVCCNVIGLLRNTSRPGILSLLQPTHVILGTGYPKLDSSGKSVWDKLLVKIDSNIYNNLCTTTDNGHKRQKREIETKYLDKKLLYTILAKNKEDIERDINLTILQIKQPQGDTDSTSGNTTAILLGCLTASIALLIVLGICYVIKMKHVKVNHKDVFGTFHFGLPTAFNSKTFVGSNWLSKRIHGNKDKQRRFMSGFPWTIFMKEHSLPKSEILNNIDKAYEWPDFNNLVKCSENLVEELEVDNLKKAERLVTVFSGEKSFVMAKENCKRDSCNMQQVTLKDLDDN